MASGRQGNRRQDGSSKEVKGVNNSQIAGAQLNSSTGSVHKCQALLRSAVRCAHSTQPPLLSRYQRCSFTSPYMAAIWEHILLESGEKVGTQARIQGQQTIRILSTICQGKVLLLGELVSEVPATWGKRKHDEGLPNRSSRMSWKRNSVWTT